MILDGNLPASSSVTYTFSGTLSPTATGTLTNTARVITPASGVSDPPDLGRTGAGNNSATDNTTINPIPIVNLVKRQSQWQSVAGDRSRLHNQLQQHQ